MRAAVYCRISRDTLGDELGVRRQLKECSALCEREGYEIAARFTDDDRSAYSGKPRPEFDRMTEALRAGTFDVLVAWHPDRLTRQPRELEDLIDLLDETRTTVRTVQTGEYDLSTPSGRMAARIVGAVARGESEHKAERLRSKHRELAENGKLSGGGTRPFGYHDDRVTVDKTEAKIIRDLTARALAGESLHSLAVDLGDRGITGTTGKQWTPAKLRTMLTSARIAGLRSHRGEVIGDAVWPAIIDPDDHYRLCSMLLDPKRRKSPGGRPRKLLTGLVICGKCGERMVSRPRQDRADTYVCPSPPVGTGCGGTRILGEPLNDLVTAAALHRLDSPAVLEALQPVTDDRAVLADLEALGVRREELAEMWANGEIGRREWQTATAALDKRQAKLEQALGDSTESAAVAAQVAELAGVADRWAGLPHERRRAVLAAIIDAVTIGPAVRGRNRFDPDRVEVTWRA